MRLFSLVAAMSLGLGLGLAPAARAQDAVLDYTAAFNSYYLPGAGMMDEDATHTAITAMLPRLQGDWVRGDLLSAGKPLLDRELVAQACARHFDRLVLTGPQGFEMQRSAGDGTVKLHIRYEYLGLQNFQRSYDEAEWLAFLGYDDERPVTGRVFHAQARGEVTLFVPAPGIMVLHSMRGIPEIYVRCP